MTCPVCNARGDRPCTDGDAVLAQWHVERSIAAARVHGVIDHATAGAELRRKERVATLRARVAELRSKP